MKQYLIVMTMLLTLATTTQAAAQKHRHSAAVTTTAPVAVQDTTGIEAFSDTTGLAEDSLDAYSTPTHYQIDVSSDIDRIVDEIPWRDVAGMLMVVCIVAIMFLLSPVLIIGLIFYFINKNRKDKLKLAQMAIQQGRPIPEQLIRERQSVSGTPYRGGITQMCLGIGLMAFLGMMLGKLGFGIGALVFFIGLGKLIIALIDHQQAEKQNNVPPTRRQTPPDIPTTEE